MNYEQYIHSDHYRDVGIEAMFFPGGEPHVKLPNFGCGKRVLYTAILRNWNDTGFAALIMDALTRQGVHLDCFIPYFPGMRQDKTNKGLDPLTCSVTARLLAYGQRVWTFDPHSYVALDMITQYGSPSAKVRGMSVKDLRMPLNFSSGLYDCIIVPDEGAVMRAQEFRDRHMPGFGCIYYRKRRDPVSGRILSYDIKSWEHAAPAVPKRALVIDDICDGGATFNMLADAIVKESPGIKLELYVSHGIFSKGLEALHPIYEHIYTTDSWCRMQDTARISVINLLSCFTALRSAAKC